MSRYHSYINSAAQILEQYNGKEPFASFLKKFFAVNKKYGSTDRRQISHLCYCYFRLGKAAINLPVEERILTGLFLCTIAPNEILKSFKPGWNDKTNLPVKEKYLLLNIDKSENVFPWYEELSEGISNESFCESFFIQPDLFIRIRPNHKDAVLSKLSKLEVENDFISPFTVRLPNSIKTDQYFELDKEVVIQDYSSQQIAHFIPVNHDKQISVWDCCAASGGKAIMAYDVNGNISLTVSDVRESIIANLKKRFDKAGVKEYKSFIADLTGNQNQVTGNYDFIIADVPCTGSGTWGRTPEQISFFEKSEIERYSALQKKIISNVISHVAPNGQFLYITCSVFKKENEENAEFIKNQFNLELVKMELIKGYDKKADTMFAALFKLNL